MDNRELFHNLSPASGHKRQGRNEQNYRHQPAREGKLVRIQNSMKAQDKGLPLLLPGHKKHPKVYSFLE